MSPEAAVVDRDVHEIGPGEGYDIDSDEFDSDDEAGLDQAEYDRLVDEAENGFSEDEVKAMVARLKEQGLVTFLRDYLRSVEGNDEGEPSLRKLLLGFGIVPPIHLRHASTPNLALLPFTRLSLARILRRRAKLPQYNTLDDAVRLLSTARNIIVLSGAGISTSCGIPDFRSSGGLYAQLQAEGRYDLDDPQQMFDIHYFREHPEVFYSFAKQIYPSNFIPSPCHRWIKLLEDKGLLLRNYTQNIDTLESLAGVEKVLQCHAIGSFKTASCLRCKTRVPGKAIEPHIMSQTIPFCDLCRATRAEELARSQAAKKARRKAKGKGKAPGWGSSGSESSEEDEWGGGEPGIMKPDITFFGQALDSEFDQCLWRDREKVDLLVIIGTSLKVAPVSEVLVHIPHSVPQIFINLTPVTHVKPDICLLGDADTIVTHLSRRLGWTIPPAASTGGPAQRDVAEFDDLVWLSGVGEMSHMHFLSTKEDKQRMDQLRMTQNNEGTPSSGGSGDGDSSVSSVEAGVEHVHVTAPEAGSGGSESGSGDESGRPSKRAKTFESVVV